MARRRVSHISERTVRVWRDKATGRHAKPHAMGAEQVDMRQQVDQSGKVLRSHEVLRHVVTKTATIDGQAGYAPGLISWSLYKTNVTTRLKDARRITITVRGKDHRDKTKRIRKVLIVAPGTKPGRAADYLIWGIVQSMRQRGYRTQYNIDTVKFTHTKYTKTAARKLKQLHDVAVTVKVERR